MQSKVSMVIPCYNKVKYISKMFDSIIEQKWDNIEVILVNDGSTDGTQEIIADYVPKFRTRGFEVVSIDQENGGCCKAVHSGLLRMTGEYFCLVDADDELDPQYVSKMATFLDENLDYEMAACSFKSIYIDNQGEKTEGGYEWRFYKPDTNNLLLKYILRRVITQVWIYMSRISYVKKCKLIENFNTARNITYEPLILVPLAFGGGKIKFYDEPLYHFNRFANELFQFDSFDKVNQFYNDYHKQYEWSIGKLEANEAQKIKLLQIAKMVYYVQMIYGINDLANNLCKKYTEEAHTMFSSAVDTEALLSNFYKFGYIGFVDFVCCDELNELKCEYSRVIGYGALGRAAQRLLPPLENSAFYPTILWDKNGDGQSVFCPDFNSLTANDLVIVLLAEDSIDAELKSKFNNSSATVYYRKELNYLINAIESKKKFSHIKWY